MNRVFTYGRLRYEYDFLTSERKTISLTVWPDMRLTVKAPPYAKDEQIERFLKRKWRWLDVQLRFFARYCRKRYRREYISGEEVFYLGKQYQLLVQRATQDNVKLLRGKLLVSTTHGVDDATYTKKLLDVWYRRRMKTVFAERYAFVQQRFPFKEFPKLEIRSMPKRWGSFVSGKKIILNPVLVQTSKECIDYVITHELCHMRYKNHSRQFFQLLEKQFPGWEKVKLKLEERTT